MKKLLLFGAIALSTATFAQVPNYVPTNGLVGWWPFTGNANDESGNGNNGIVNGPQLSNDRFGNPSSSYEFNGGQDIISTTYQNNSLPTYTVSIWLKIDSLNPAWIIVEGGNQSGISYNFDNGLGMNDIGVFKSYVFNGVENWLTGDTLSVNESWNNVIYSFSSVFGMKLYFNGSLIATNPSILNNQGLNGYWRFGGCTHPGQSSLFGNLDDVGIWNRELSICEIQDLYNAQIYSSDFISAGMDQSICEGSTVTFSGIGGSNYQWNNGVVDGTPFTPTATQNYIVTAEDGNGCIGVDTVLVTVNSLPAINGGADQIICEGDPVTLSGSGGNSYNWDNGITNGVSFTPTHLGDLMYTVTGTDANNCSNSDEVIVTVNEHTTSTQTETALDSYTWPINNQTYSQSGTYTAVIQNAAGCDSTITLNLTLQFTGIGENGANFLAIYPNPTTSFLTIEGERIQNKEYTLVDIQGRIVLNGTFKTNKETIDLKTIGRGQYMLRVEGKKLKVVKE